MSAYTDADVRAAFRAIGCVPVTRERLGNKHPMQECRRHQRLWPCNEGVQLAEDVLDAVAPAIAARALREAADALAGASPSAGFAPGWLAAELGLRARATGIEHATP